MILCMAVAIISIIGLGASVYKYNTGSEMPWMPVVGEIATLCAASYFIYTYFSRRDKDNDK